MSTQWSALALAPWGKTDRETGGWLPVVRHLEDSAAVAGLLWDHWLPGCVRARISGSLGDDDEGRVLVSWAAGCHDIGKITPAFAVKLRREPGYGGVLDEMERLGLALPPGGVPSGLKPHCLLGQQILREWLMATYDVGPDDADTWVSVVGAHHGVPPTASQLDGISTSLDLGQGQWERCRAEVLAAVASFTGSDTLLPRWLEGGLDQRVQVMVAAVVMVADWLASDSTRFPYDDLRPAKERAAVAVGEWDLPAPWSPEMLTGTVANLLSVRFPRLGGQGPRAVQQAAVEAAQRVTRAPLLVVEAGTGEGKTEAALLAAEVLAGRFGAGGLLFALPTMATADGVLPRVRDFMRAQHGQGRTSFFLAHSKRGLNDDYQGLIRAGRVVGVYDESSTSTEVVVTSWLDGRRKGVLANAVVGTVDQLLFGALRARHLPLRHLALAGKVVIVDEVHAADAFMRVYLTRMLQWLGAYGVPVVVLTATLPPLIRAELVRAYAEGAGIPVGTLPAGDRDLLPRITVVDDSVRDLPVEQPRSSRGVFVSNAPEGDPGVWDAVTAAVEDGAVVGVIHNTVRRAQGTYDLLLDRLGPERVMLAHSRFVSCQRSDRDRELRELLGPPSQGGAERPHGLVVVGTQVLEQSLDIDVDMMVTDLAPIDLVLQRAGRLHRHRRGEQECDRPADVRVARLLITGFTPVDGAPPELERGSVRVYGERALLAAAMVLQRILAGDRLRLPFDVPRLVREGYDPALVPLSGWEQRWQDAIVADDRHRAAQVDRAGAHLLEPPGASDDLRTWARARAEEPGAETARARAAVRDIEDSLEVILIRRVGDELFPLPDVGLEQVPLPVELGPPEPAVARRLAECTVTLPAWMTQGSRMDVVISQLEKRSARLTGWQQSRWLVGELVLDLDENLTSSVAGCTVTYDIERGLRVVQEG